MGTIKFANINHIVDVAEFRGLHGIRHDLSSAVKIAQHLQRALSGSEDQALEIVDGLSTALVVRYSRAFVSGVRDSPHANSAVAELSNEQRAIHETLITMRNKHIAHSVNAQEESWVGAQYYEERVKQDGFVAVAVQYGRVIGFGTDELQWIIDLMQTLLAFIDDRVREEEARLLPAPTLLDAEEILRDPRSERTWDHDRTPLHKRRTSP